MELDKSSADIGRRMAKGASWTVGARMAVRLLGFFSTIILARLLVPSDYGLIALATLIAASIEMFGAFNFEVWIIRHPDPDHYHYNTVWTLSAIRGLVGCGLLLVLAAPAGLFFDDARLEGVVMVLAFSTLLSNLSNVGAVDFAKHLRFDKEFLILAGSKIGSFLVAVTLALIFRSYWALVAGIVTGQLIKVVMTYWMHRHRPRFCVKHWREVLQFTKWLLLGNFMGFFYNRTDTFVLGKLMSSQMLGLYTIAHEIANLASTEIVMPIRKVMLPGYSKLTGDMVRLRKSFADGLGIIMLIGMPCAAGVGLVSDPLVRALLGEKWLETIPLIQILAVYGMASVGMANQSPLLISLGHARIMTQLIALGFIILLPAFTLATIEYGVLGGAWAVGLTNVLLFVIGIFVTLRKIDLPVQAVHTRIWRTVLATIAMAFVVISIQALQVVQAWWAIVELLVCIAAGGVTYVFSVLALWYGTGRPEGPETIAMDFLFHRGTDRTLVPQAQND